MLENITEGNEIILARAYTNSFPWRTDFICEEEEEEDDETGSYSLMFHYMTLN